MESKGSKFLSLVLLIADFKSKPELRAVFVHFLEGSKFKASIVHVVTDGTPLPALLESRPINHKTCLSDGMYLINHMQLRCKIRRKARRLAVVELPTCSI